MRDYQRQKNNPYKLPRNLYMRMLYLVRDYERLKSERDDILNSSPPSDGLPHSGIGNPTENKAIKLAALGDKCDAIDKALETVPPEYRKAVRDNICFRSPYPIFAGETTFKRWRCRFIYEVAKNLHEI